MTLSQQRFTALVAAVFGYMIKFSAYGFLLPVIAITFVALFFIYTTVGSPEIPFLEYAFDLLPVGRGGFDIDEDDIMLAYGVVTMALFLLSLAGGWLLRALRRGVRRIFRPVTEAGAEEEYAPLSQSPLSYGKRRLIVSSIVITVIYLVAFVVMPFAGLADGTSLLSMYLLFAFFYVIAMIANVLCIGIDTLSDVMLGWAWSRALSTQNFNEEPL